MPVYGVGDLPPAGSVRLEDARLVRVGPALAVVGGDDEQAALVRGVDQGAAQREMALHVHHVGLDLVENPAGCRA
nr:hypothetical protein [Actinoplanes auranticolor]